MRKVTFVLAALTFVLGASLSRAADEPATQPAPGMTNNNAPANNAGAPAMGTSQAAQTPPDNWTSLKGTVQSVDAASKTVQIQDNTGAMLQVPVDRQVSIQKDGKRVKLSQLQAGDSITLAKRNPSSEEKKQQAY